MLQHIVVFTSQLWSRSVLSQRLMHKSHSLLNMLQYIATYCRTHRSNVAVAQFVLTQSIVARTNHSVCYICCKCVATYRRMHKSHTVYCGMHASHNLSCMLQICCKYVANILQIYCKYVANMLQHIVVWARYIYTPHAVTERTMYSRTYTTRSHLNARCIHERTPHAVT